VHGKHFILLTVIICVVGLFMKVFFNPLKKFYCEKNNLKFFKTSWEAKQNFYFWWFSIINYFAFSCFIQTILPQVNWSVMWDISFLFTILYLCAVYFCGASIADCGAVSITGWNAIPSANISLYFYSAPWWNLSYTILISFYDRRIYVSIVISVMPFLIDRNFLAWIKLQGR